MSTPNIFPEDDPNSWPHLPSTPSGHREAHKADVFFTDADNPDPVAVAAAREDKRMKAQNDPARGHILKERPVRVTATREDHLGAENGWRIEWVWITEGTQVY